MKNSLIIISCMVLFVACGTKPIDTRYSIDMNGLPVLEKPDVHAKVVAHIPFHSKVDILQYSDDDSPDVRLEINGIKELGKWVNIRYNRIEGWTSAEGLYPQLVGKGDIKWHVFYISPFRNIDLSYQGNAYKQIRSIYGKPLSVKRKKIHDQGGTDCFLETSMYDGFDVVFLNYGSPSDYQTFMSMTIYKDMGFRFNIKMGMDISQVSDIFESKSDSEPSMYIAEKFEELKFIYANRKLSKIEIRQLWP